METTNKNRLEIEAVQQLKAVAVSDPKGLADCFRDRFRDCQQQTGDTRAVTFIHSIQSEKVFSFLISDLNELVSAQAERHVEKLTNKGMSPLELYAHFGGECFKQPGFLEVFRQLFIDDDINLTTILDKLQIARKCRMSGGIRIQGVDSSREWTSWDAKEALSVLRPSSDNCHLSPISIDSGAAVSNTKSQTSLKIGRDVLSFTAADKASKLQTCCDSSFAVDDDCHKPEDLIDEHDFVSVEGGMAEQELVQDVLEVQNKLAHKKELRQPVQPSRAEQKHELPSATSRKTQAAIDLAQDAEMLSLRGPSSHQTSQRAPTPSLRRTERPSSEGFNQPPPKRVRFDIDPLPITSGSSEMISQKEPDSGCSLSGALESLVPGKWVNATAISKCLSALNLRPTCIKVFDAGFLSTDSAGSVPSCNMRLYEKHRWRYLLFPLHHAGHWTLGVIDTVEHTYLVFDPDKSQAWRTSSALWLQEFARSIDKNVDWELQPANGSYPLSYNGIDCGVFVMLVAMTFLFPDLVLPSKIYSTNVFRQFFRSMISDNAQPLDRANIFKVTSSSPESPALPNAPTEINLHPGISTVWQSVTSSRTALNRLRATHELLVMILFRLEAALLSSSEEENTTFRNLQLALQSYSERLTTTEHQDREWLSQVNQFQAFARVQHAIRERDTEESINRKMFKRGTRCLGKLVEGLKRELKRLDEENSRERRSLMQSMDWLRGAINGVEMDGE